MRGSRLLERPDPEAAGGTALVETWPTPLGPSVGAPFASARHGDSASPVAAHRGGVGGVGGVGTPLCSAAAVATTGGVSGAVSVRRAYAAAHGDAGALRGSSPPLPLLLA